MSDTLIVSPMAAQLYQDEFMPPTIAISQIASYSAANTKTKQVLEKRMIKNSYNLLENYNMNHSSNPLERK